jgi:hypothetical protein
MLRALETLGVFAQVSPGVFANTKASEFLRKDVPGSQWAGVMSLASIGGGQFDAWSGLLDAIQTGQVAFDRVHRCNVWEFRRKNPQQGAIFDEAMRSFTAAVAPTITAAYDWSRFRVIADIGGGIGTQLADILNAHPSCKGVLFDQPAVVARAIPHERIERASGSFFERVPAGADAYTLRWVIHDWGDAESLAILKNVRSAAKPESRVILIERLLLDAPEYAFNKWADLVMLVITGGQERTGTEYRQLLEKAGLDVEKIVPTAGPFSLVISRPRA